MGILYTKPTPDSTEHLSPNPSKSGDEFAQAALGDAFRGRDLSLAREPDFVDCQPRRLGEITTKIVVKTGQKACLHWIDQAARAGTQQERAAALEIAQNIAESLGLTLEDFLFGRAA